MEFELTKQLAERIVEPSAAPSSAPVLVVRKESSKSGYRICVDFMEANKYINTKYKFQFPRCKLFCRQLLDLRSGYWQFHVHPDDRHKLTFKIHIVQPQWVA